jgi:hypothetical protein
MDAQVSSPRKDSVKVSEKGYSGSSHGPADPHQEFQELCALSTTRELTVEEWARLIEHLAHCDSCRGPSGNMNA